MRGHVLVESVQDRVLVIRFLRLLFFQLTIEVFGIVAKLGYPEVKSDDLGAAFPTGDFDEVMHEKPRLNDRPCLLQDNGCKLSDNQCGGIGSHFHALEVSIHGSLVVT